MIHYVFCIKVTQINRKRDHKDIIKRVARAKFLIDK